MKSLHSLLPLLAGALVASSVVSCRSSNPETAYYDEIEPILANYCYDCHGEGSDKGDIALDHHEAFSDLKADRELWEGIYSNIDSLLMPPSDRPQLRDDEKETIIAWIERDVFELDPKNPDPGKPVIRRLNRSEYNDAVSDLFDLPLRPADRFPEDDTGYGFDNIGEVLTLSPSLMEKYLISAEEIMDQVIPTKPVPPDHHRFQDGTFQKKNRGRFERTGGTLASNGTIGVQFTSRKAGEYQIRISARGSQAKNDWPLMRVEIENASRKDWKVSTSVPRTFDLPVRLQASDEKRWVAVSFLNDLYDPGAKDPNQRDRNLYVTQIEVIGPIETEPPPPAPSYRKWLEESRTEPDEPAKARKILTSVATRAWRKPPQPGEIDQLLGLYNSAKSENGSFDQGVKQAITGILISPRFLFRGEPESAAAATPSPGRSIAIDDYSLASRLSFFLWNSLPDEELLALAAAGKLRDQLADQIERMLSDKRSRRFTENFSGQWLQLRNLDLASPDPGRYRDWNETLRESMRRETEHFFAHLLTDNRPVLEFLDSDYTFIDKALAAHYGLRGSVKGGGFEKVIFEGDQKSRRGGLLTQASILTITSNPTRTSPVNRGNFVLENILGTPPPPPPEDLEIPALESAGGESGEDLTLRRQLEIHREKKLCASCHSRMDPIGFALENFDAIGKWRDQDKGKPIDTSGKLYTGESFQGIAELKHLLLEEKSDAFVKCLSEKLLTYALGRGLEYYDKPAVAEIVRRTSADQYRFHSLILAIVESVPFQRTRLE